MLFANYNLIKSNFNSLIKTNNNMSGVFNHRIKCCFAFFFFKANYSRKLISDWEVFLMC